MPSAYPTLAELTARMEAEGLTVPSNAQNRIYAAIERWEGLTGFKPFLGATSATARTFDPPSTNEYLNFDGGFWAITSVVCDGDTLTETDDYDLLPLNAAADDRPWTALRFRRHMGSKLASIVVTGKRGYAEELPYEVYEAIMDGAIAECIAPGILGLFVSPSRIKQGQIEIESDSGAGSKAIEYAQKFMDLASKPGYRRIDL